MQGVHAFDPKATASIDLESFVAADHFLRRVDRVLDLSFVRELTAPRYAVQQGRPSIDPEVYFRMQLVAYFFGVTSERQLCEDVYYNLAYRWFCRLWRTRCQTIRRSHGFATVTAPRSSSRYSAGSSSSASRRGWSKTRVE